MQNMQSLFQQGGTAASSSLRAGLSAGDFVFRSLRTGRNDEELHQVFALRYTVYCQERGYLPSDRYPDNLESDGYDADSVHFSAYGGSADLVGALRLVRSAGTEGFPFERYCKTRFADFVAPRASECAEVSRLVVRRDYRNDSHESWRSPSHILLGLYRELYRYSIGSGIRYWYAAMEKPLARALARYEFVFSPIGVESDYFGRVTPYMADLRELEDRLCNLNPELLSWFSVAE